MKLRVFIVYRYERYIYIWCYMLRDDYVALHDHGWLRAWLSIYECANKLNEFCWISRSRVQRTIIMLWCFRIDTFVLLYIYISISRHIWNGKEVNVHGLWIAKCVFLLIAYSLQSAVCTSAFVFPSGIRCRISPAISHPMRSEWHPASTSTLTLYANIQTRWSKNHINMSIPICIFSPLSIYRRGSSDSRSKPP